MTTRFRVLLFNGLVILGLIGNSVSSLAGSSNIFDGIVVAIVDGEIHIRATYTPYSSVPSAMATMTRRDGHFVLVEEDLSSFMSYYIDEIPVTETVMTA